MNLRYVLLTIPLIGSVPLQSVAQQTPYFQQEVNFTIEVKLDDRNHMLRGNETFEYINNSPDTLRFLYIHLWPNAYRTRTTALARQLARDGNFILFGTLKDNKGYIDSLNFKVDGERAIWSSDEKHIDIARLDLTKPLAPGGRILVTTPFVVKLPSGSISRLGHVGESYQVTQWFPKPAVYDRDGWHPMPYLSQGEFYSEFGSFDVSITLPENYVVGATGDLQNESELNFLDSLAVRGTDRPDLLELKGFPPSANRMKTIRYVQSQVHDFAWFADKRWMVLKGEVTTPHSGQAVTTWAMFTPAQKKLWEKAPEYLHDAVHYYSLWNGDYPYKQVTAVDGTISAGGGMEYPNVTVIGHSGNARSLETVIMHEVGHNWFYGILGSNERMNAWMDEGLNSFNEERYMETKYPAANLGEAIGLGASFKLFTLDQFPQRSLADLMYRFNASRNLDQPLQCHAEHFTSINYGGIVYKKTALLMFYLKTYLGEEMFDRCMRSYFEEWKFKHPGPEDFREVMERVSGKNLDWFFDDLVQTTGKIDFSLRRIRQQKNGVIEVKVKNTGETRGPVTVGLVKNPSPGLTQSTDRIAVSNVLHPGESQWLQFMSEDGDRLVLIDPGADIPQINRHNDRMRIRGPLRKVEPLSLRPFTGLEVPWKTQLFWIPLVAWNEYDKWMAGISLHNKTITRKPLEWSVSPMYSFSRERLSGFSGVEWHQGNVTTGIRAQQFSSGSYTTPLGNGQSWYALAEPYIRWTIRPETGSVNEGAQIVTQVRYQSVWQTNRFEFSEPPVAYRQTRNQEAVILSADASYRSKPFHQWKASAASAISTDFFERNSPISGDVGQIHHGQLSYQFLYNVRKKKHIRARLFAGTTTGGNRRVNLFSPSGITGPSDLFYDALYLGRQESTGLLSRQMVSGMGMLRTPLPWRFRSLVALNAEWELPVRFPLMLSANLASTDFAGLVSSDEMLASLVLSVPLIRDILEVHVPLVQSQVIRNAQKDMGYDFAEKIMFTLHLNALSPFSLIRNVAP